MPLPLPLHCGAPLPLHLHRPPTPLSLATDAWRLRPRTRSFDGIGVGWRDRGQIWWWRGLSAQGCRIQRGILPCSGLLRRWRLVALFDDGGVFCCGGSASDHGGDESGHDGALPFLSRQRSSLPLSAATRWHNNRCLGGPAKPEQAVGWHGGLAGGATQQRCGSGSVPLDGLSGPVDGLH